MRKVKFNKAEQIKHPNKGIFLDWGLFDGSTVALVELESGSVEMVKPCDLRFEKESSNKDTSKDQMLLKANEQAKCLVDRMGVPGARTTCLQEMRETSNTEHYKFWCIVNDLIPTR